jgi:hypothetical protein
MLHAQVHSGSSAWIVSLVYGTEDICILTLCDKEADAKAQAARINSQIIPKQKILVDKLENTQKALKSILDKVGPLPTTSDEFVLALHKAVKYIEAGKQTTEINHIA